jgi:hypothetical protein
MLRTLEAAEIGEAACPVAPASRTHVNIVPSAKGFPTFKGKELTDFDSRYGSQPKCIIWK